MDEVDGHDESRLTYGQAHSTSLVDSTVEPGTHLTSERALHVVPAAAGNQGDRAVQRTLEAIPQPALAVAFDGTILSVNAAGNGWAGLGRLDVIGRPLAETLGTASAAAVSRALSAMAAGELDNIEVAARMATGAGQASDVALTVAIVRDEAGTASSAVVLIRDDSARERDAADLRHRASHDGLTELPNRAAFLDRLVQALARDRRRGSWSAVLFVDLDGFKAVNDTLGHSVGDELLFSAAGRVRRVMRPEDTLARYGGDEFTVLCEDLHGADEAAAIAQRVLDVFDVPFRLSAGTTSLSTSIGVAVVGGGSMDAPSVIAAADAAMYASKAAGGGRYAVHDVTPVEAPKLRVVLTSQPAEDSTMAPSP